MSATALCSDCGRKIGRRRVVSISLDAARALLHWFGDADLSVPAAGANPALQPHLDELRAGLGYNTLNPERNVARKFFGARRERK